MALRRALLSNPLNGEHATPQRCTGIGGLLRAIGLSPSPSPSLSALPNPSLSPDVSPCGCANVSADGDLNGDHLGGNNGEPNGIQHGSDNGINDGPADGPDVFAKSPPLVSMRRVGDSLVIARTTHLRMLLPIDHANALLAFLQPEFGGLWIAATDLERRFYPCLLEETDSRSLA